MALEDGVGVVGGGVCVVRGGPGVSAGRRGEWSIPVLPSPSDSISWSDLSGMPVRGRGVQLADGPNTAVV